MQFRHMPGCALCLFLQWSPRVASPVSTFPLPLVTEPHGLQTTAYPISRFHLSGLSPWFKCRHMSSAVLGMNFSTLAWNPGTKEYVLCPSGLVCSYETCNYHNHFAMREDSLQRCQNTGKGLREMELQLLDEADPEAHSTLESPFL